MIEITHVKRRCGILRRDVILSVCCYEDDRTNLRTPAQVEGCDSAARCHVKGPLQPNWPRCPFFGKKP